MDLSLISDRFACFCLCRPSVSRSLQCVRASPARPFVWLRVCCVLQRMHRVVVFGCSHTAAISSFANLPPGRELESDVDADVARKQLHSPGPRRACALEFAGDRRDRRRRCLRRRPRAVAALTVGSSAAQKPE